MAYSKPGPSQSVVAGPTPEEGKLLNNTPYLAELRINGRLPMIVSSRIRRTITITTCAAALGAGIAAIASSASAHTASPPAAHSPRQVAAVCQGDRQEPVETRSIEHRFVDFDSWVECIAVNIPMDEIISWIRLEFDYKGPGGYAKWLPVTGWREKYFPGVSEMKFWSNQSLLCEGAYDGQFRAQAYAKAYFSDGAVIRFPQPSGYATSTQAGIDC
jgi:hypothetical protein